MCCFFEEKLWWGFLHLVNCKWSKFLAKFKKKISYLWKICKKVQIWSTHETLSTQTTPKDFQRFLTFRKLFETSRVVYLPVEFPIFNKFGNWHHSGFFLWHNSFVCRLKFSSNSRHLEQTKVGKSFSDEIHRNSSEEAAVPPPPPDEKKASRSTWRVLSTSVLWALSRHALLERGHVCTDLP